MHRIDFIAMGCDISVFLDSIVPDAEECLLQAPEWFEEWEQALSRFRPSSELCALNRFAGYWFHPDDVLWNVLTAALAGAARTDGRVTPTVLPQLLAAGYDRSFDLLELHNHEDDSVAPTAHPVDDWRTIQIDADQRRVLLPPGMALDFGGIAKGWAADQTALRLAHLGGVLVDAGGDIVARGRRIDGTPWPIGITDPRSSDAQEIDLPSVLLIYAGGVVTSGRDHRCWKHRGRAQHHIIDPRTGLPAATDVISATVVAADAVTAEIIAKDLLLLGCDAGLRWIESQTAAAALLVTNDGVVHSSSRFSSYMWRDAAITIPS